MVVAASMSVLLTSRTGKRSEWLPWTLLIVGSLASLAANVAVAEPTLVSRLIVAWPSFAFVGAYHLLQGQLRIRRIDEPCGSGEPDVQVSVFDLPGDGDDQTRFSTDGLMSKEPSLAAQAHHEVRSST
jgi:hypothetical protein